MITQDLKLHSGNNVLAPEVEIYLAALRTSDEPVLPKGYRHVRNAVADLLADFLPRGCD